MALALVVLWDVAIRWPWRQALWGEDGAVPAAVASQSSGYLRIFPLDSPWAANIPPELLFGLVAGAAIALALGWRARLMTFVLFAGLVTLHLRSPLTQHAGDVLLRLMLFWSMFLPLGRTWSLARGDRTDGHSSVLLVRGLPAAAFVIQLLVVYAFAVLLKLRPAWLSQGSAVHLALHLDQLVTPLGVWLRQFPGLTRILTWVTLLVELALPLLILLGSRGVMRVIAIALAVALHLGFGSMLNLGTFIVIPIVCWLALLPSSFWEGGRIGSVTGQDSTSASEPQAGPAPGWSHTAILLPAVALCTWINLGWLVPRLGPPAIARSAAGAIGLDQRWSMFAPIPILHDGWWSARAIYEDGMERDLLRDGTRMNWSAPQARSSLLPSQHWRLYFIQLWYPWRRQYRPPLARWFCDGHQLPHDTVGTRPRPQRVELWFSLEESQWPGGPKPVVPLLMEHRWCTVDSTLPPPMPQPVVPGLLPPPPPPS